ncbi:hypothetical protein D3C85_1468330 [compost metagenome]
MSQAPEATAYTAPRKASVPDAQKFSTRVIGIFCRRRAVLIGSALLPTLICSKAEASQAASMSFVSIPASCRASW